MGMLFNADRRSIIYNGYRLFDMLGLYALDLEVIGDNMLGLNRSISFNDKNNFIEGKDELFTLELTFARFRNGNITELDNRTLEELNRIIFSKKDDVNVMQVGSYIIYVQPTSGTLRKLYNGYVTIQFQSLSPYAYSPIMINSIYVEKEKSFEVINRGITETYADVELQVLNDGIVEITNTSFGKSIFINVTQGQVIKLDGENADVDGCSFSDISGDYNALKLSYGTNRYTIKGNAKVNFKYQAEYGIR